MIVNHESIDVFIGLDSGKGERHTAAVDRQERSMLTGLFQTTAWLLELLPNRKNTDAFCRSFVSPRRRRSRLPGRCHDRAAPAGRMLTNIRESGDTVFTQAEALVKAHPLDPVLTSFPAVGVRTAGRILTKVVGKDFASAGHMPLTQA